MTVGYLYPQRHSHKDEIPRLKRKDTVTSNHTMTLSPKKMLSPRKKIPVSQGYLVTTLPV